MKKLYEKKLKKRGSRGYSYPESQIKLNKANNNQLSKLLCWLKSRKTFKLTVIEETILKVECLIADAQWNLLAYGPMGPIRGQRLYF